MRLNHENPEIYFNLGNILFRRKDYLGAAEQFEEAIRLDASPRVAAINLGQCYEQLGRLQDASKIYREAMAMKGDASDALSALSDLPITPTGIDVLAALEKSMNCGRQRSRDAAISLEFVYARALDKAGRHAEAWAAIVEANRKVLASGGGDRQRERQQEQDTLRWANSCPTVIAPPPNPGTPFVRPVFILGASRSGKSTVERLMGTFTGVKCGFENQLVRESVRSSNQIAGRLGLEVFQELPEQLYPIFTKNFLERLNRVAGNASAYTTTTPGQIHNVPRLMATIPGGLIIFVKRDILDTVLRIFFGKYKFGNDYSYAVSSALDHVAWYHSLIDLFVEKYPANTLLIQYEDLVRDTGNVVDRLARFCRFRGRPDTLLPIGDDTGCAAPYRELLQQHARAQAGSGL